MIWPNEFAMWVIGILGITSDNVVGAVTLACIFVYFVVGVMLPAAAMALVGEAIERKNRKKSQ